MKLAAFLKKSPENAVATFKRFRLPLLCAYIAAFIMIYYIGLSHELERQHEYLLRYFFTFNLGFMFFYIVDLLAEEKSFKREQRFIGYILSVILLVLFYLFETDSLGQNFNPFDSVRFALIFFGTFAIAVSAPFWGTKNKLQAFWQYNMKLLEAIIWGFVFFGLLYIGSVSIVASVDYLFELNIDGDVYGRLWFLLAGVGATTYVLYKIPKGLMKLEKDKSYPKPLEVINRNILIPVVGVYALVVYAYAIKIIANLDLPIGGASSQILGFCLAGVLAYAFVYPIKDKSMYLGFYHRWFFTLIIPMIAMLFVSIGVRVEQYGFTEPRYFVVLFGLLIAFWSAYFTFDKKKDIRAIPIAIVVSFLIALYGPFNATIVSLNSQSDRLVDELTKHEVIVDGAFNTPEHVNALDLSDKGRISGLISYLSNNYGVDIPHKVMNSILDEDIDFLELSEESNPEVAAIMEEFSVMHDLFNPRYTSGIGPMYFGHNIFESRSIDVSGYSKMVGFDLFERDNNIEVDGYEFELNVPDALLELKLNGTVVGSVHLPTFIDEMDEIETASVEVNGYKFQFNSINGYTLNDETVITDVSGFVLVR